MAKSPEELLALRVGDASVADNIRRAVERRDLVEDADGTLQLAAPRSYSANWAIVANGPALGCQFLIHFLYRHAYAEAAVPHGCGACYKVKVAPRTLRELVAAWGVAKRVACRSKWGVDLGNPYSQNVYAGYFYTTGLDGARAVYKVVRAAIDDEPKLGPDVQMSIKRGCSDYEAKLGPSDRYTFAPELEELEKYLKSRFRKVEPEGLPPVPLAHWIEIAFRIGDDTYLDFTGGRRPKPNMVSYAP